MKTNTIKFTLYSVAIFFLLSITACNNSNKHAKETAKQEAVEHEHKVENAKYQCPMKCEEDKTYNKKGKCPVCGMDLKEVKNI